MSDTSKTPCAGCSNREENDLSRWCTMFEWRPEKPWCPFHSIPAERVRGQRIEAALAKKGGAA